MEFKQALFKAFENAVLPGWEVQKAMAPIGRKGPPEIPHEQLMAYKKAAVLMCFCNFTRNDAGLIMIKRTFHKNDPHSGQMAFPGGMLDENDQSLQMAALREFSEETGIKPSPRIIGELSPLPIPVSRYYVKPFVGILEHDIKCSIDRKEVEKLYLIPFSHFMIPRNKGEHYIKNNIKVPCWKYQEEIIWGASAMMLEELVFVLNRSFF
ncbi:MAG: CoA pyrophosphatase [Bacteroidia bacterium]|nr:CoA pyrophosphatase [Bacteroidia bacterium]